MTPALVWNPGYLAARTQASEPPTTAPQTGYDDATRGQTRTLSRPHTAPQ